MEFIAGGILGGLIMAIMLYIQLKRHYEKEIVESYNKGWKAGSEIERRSLLEYIERLENRSNKDGET